MREHMPKIHQLSLQEVQKIAAGEVIDRPANIVKELVENSLDAGATYIKICIEDGGKQLVRIIDNGCGMAQDDARLCFAHHATSKITTLRDLEQCSTFGFRGEALSSIASVSRVTLITKELESQVGIKLMLEDGAITDESIVSANTGTDLTVYDLFYTIPARKKFLKTRETEWRQIFHLVSAYCLDYPSIHFELFSDGDSIINCPPAESLIARAVQLWDFQTSNALIAVRGNDATKNIFIEGLISHHHFAKYDRSSIFMFVNRRWIKNQHLCKALLKGYANVLPPARYPAAVISIIVDPTVVDINIHPRKEEVKFLHPHVVESILCDAVKKALEERVIKKLIPQQQEFEKAQSTELPPPLFHDPMIAISNSYMSPVQKSVLGPEIKPIQAEPLNEIKFTQEPPFLHEFKSVIQQDIVVPDANLNIVEEKEKNDLPLHIIGQYKNTYILIEHGDGLMLIDQHAAHERILYEAFARRFEEVATVKTVFPIIVNMTVEDIQAVEPYLDILYAHGIHVEPFGKNQLLVSSTPVHLQKVDMIELIKQFISLLSDQYPGDIRIHINDKLRALMACASAVKAGDTLTMLEMQKLLADLGNTKNNLTCPHGRPASWILEIQEIEKKFKRDYRSKSREQ